MKSDDDQNKIGVLTDVMEKKIVRGFLLVLHKLIRLKKS